MILSNKLKKLKNKAIFMKKILPLDTQLQLFILLTNRKTLIIPIILLWLLLMRNLTILIMLELKFNLIKILLKRKYTCTNFVWNPFFSFIKIILSEYFASKSSLTQFLIKLLSYLLFLVHYTSFLILFWIKMIKIQIFLQSRNPLI